MIIALFGRFVKQKNRRTAYPAALLFASRPQSVVRLARVFPWLPAVPAGGVPPAGRAFIRMGFCLKLTSAAFYSGFTGGGRKRPKAKFERGQGLLF